MRDNKQNMNFYVKINYQKEEHELLVNFSSTVNQLKQIIFTFFKLNQVKYDIYYKNLKLENNDTRTLSLFFEKDSKPILYVLDNKKDLLPNSKKTTSMTIFSKMTQIKLNEILNKFFKYKELENDADVKNSIKGVYIINFSKPSICADFQEYYNNYLRIEEEDKNPYPKYKPATSENKRLILPKINTNYHNTYKKEENSKNLNNKKYEKYSDRKRTLNKNKLNNSKSDIIISEKYNRNGKYKSHNLDEKDNNMRHRNNNKSPKTNKYSYINTEEHDKKKLLNKKEFIPYVNQKNNNNFIPNYVSATPSESPLLFHFRDVSKDKWINPKGFH